MQTLILYAATLVIFLAVDAVGITQLVKPIFDRHIGDMIRDDLNLAPAAAFYLFYVAGVLWFVSLPALAENRPMQALIGGAVLGLMCYGTYEFTNIATLKGWSWEQVMVDCLWGAALTGGSAWAGVMIARHFG